jgi:hypothetical protein
MSKSKKKYPSCPKCGDEYNPVTDKVIECSRCGAEGSTACCNVGGVGVPCVECEQAEDEAGWPDERDYV